MGSRHGLKKHLGKTLATQRDSLESKLSAVLEAEAAMDSFRWQRALYAVRIHSLMGEFERAPNSPVTHEGVDSLFGSIEKAEMKYCAANGPGSLRFVGYDVTVRVGSIDVPVPRPFYAEYVSPS